MFLRFFLITLLVVFLAHSPTYAAVEKVNLTNLDSNSVEAFKNDFIQNEYRKAQSENVRLSYGLSPTKLGNLYILYYASQKDCGARSCRADFYLGGEKIPRKIGSISVAEEVFKLECGKDLYVLFYGAESTYTGGADINDPKYSVWKIANKEMKHIGFIRSDAADHCVAIKEIK